MDEAEVVRDRCNDDLVRTDRKRETVRSYHKTKCSPGDSSQELPCCTQGPSKTVNVNPGHRRIIQLAPYLAIIAGIWRPPPLRSQTTVQLGIIRETQGFRVEVQWSPIVPNLTVVSVVRVSLIGRHFIVSDRVGEACTGRSSRPSDCRFGHAASYSTKTPTPFFLVSAGSSCLKTDTGARLHRNRWREMALPHITPGADSG